MITCLYWIQRNLFLWNNFNDIIHGAVKGSTDLHKHIAADDRVVLTHFRYSGYADASDLSKVFLL